MLKENQHIEFKSGFNDEVIETLSAFANTKGGKVLIGVRNDGVPVACRRRYFKRVKNSNKLLNAINDQLLSVKEMMKCISLSGRDNFLREYLNPAIEQDFVAMKYPQTPSHPSMCVT